jgi:hypothetical protein
MRNLEEIVVYADEEQEKDREQFVETSIWLEMEHVQEPKPPTRKVRGEVQRVWYEPEVRDKLLTRRAPSSSRCSVSLAVC